MCQKTTCLTYLTYTITLKIQCFLLVQTTPTPVRKLQIQGGEMEFEDTVEGSFE